MSDNYYNLIRKEILQLLPLDSNVVMEVGCGAGETLNWLKKTGKCSKTIGIEYNPDIAEAAKENVDIIMSGDVEQIDPNIAEGSVDLLLCLDVLEHLRDPWTTLKKLSKYVRNGGFVIASIPNVRHKSVLLPLLFNSKWEYTTAGHLDITHLRFFVRETAISLVEGAGFSVDCVTETGLGKSRKSIMINKIIPELIKGLLVKQYLIRGVKGVIAHESTIM